MSPACMFSFHALRDESFLRNSLQRQAAALHHATVGYAVSDSVMYVRTSICVLYTYMYVPDLWEVRKTSCGEIHAPTQRQSQSSAGDPRDAAVVDGERRISKSLISCWESDR